MADNEHNEESQVEHKEETLIPTTSTTEKSEAKLPNTLHNDHQRELNDDDHDVSQSILLDSGDVPSMPRSKIQVIAIGI